ncbi:MAG TPA: hypothetical protein EYP04_09730 [Anaerolineae bacterium]|nr:hypothetical protein [Anaerolineae bacterium]
MPGYTDYAGQGPGIVAELGYGPNFTDPALGGWAWFPTSFAGDYFGLYDLYVGAITPDQEGVFDYAYRFSVDDGLTWVYADLDGTVNGYDPAQAGDMVVQGVPATDTPTPTATSTPTSTPSPTPTPTATPIGNGVKTLILINYDRLVGRYGQTAADALVAKLRVLAADPRVQGELIRVEENPAVAAAYAVWDTSPSNPSAANAVADAIKALLLGQLADYPETEYLVLVGNDAVIPFRRIPDEVPLVFGREHLYATSLDTSSAVGAAVLHDYTLSDDFYADREPTMWNGRELYLPDYAIGRLVELPEEIQTVIDAFLADQELSVADALVAGWDFLADGGVMIAAACVADGITPEVLLGDGWSAADLKEAWLAGPEKLTSLNSHASHWAFLAPDLRTLTSEEIVNASGNLSGTLVYSLGCHAGLNVPDGDPNPWTTLDLAQALARRGATFVGFTGYGWGVGHAVGLSELLMLNLIEELMAGSSQTIGQALASAKLRYYGEAAGFDFFDQKTVQEAVLYGLPMAKVRTPDLVKMRPSAVAMQVEERQAVGPVSFERRTFFPSPVQYTTADGDYYYIDAINGGAQASVDAPVQPRLSSALDGFAHGTLFRAGRYQDHLGFNPLVAQAGTTDVAVGSEPPFTSTTWYPAQLGHINSLETASGLRQTLVMLAGQYRSAGQVERVYSEMTFDIFSSTSDDRTPPEIMRVLRNWTSVSVEVQDPSGVLLVVMTYTDNQGGWASFELAPVPGSDWWRGMIPAAGAIEFIVQAVDGSGNVAIADNDGRYFSRPNCASADMNCDGVISIADVQLVAGRWGSDLDHGPYEQTYDLDMDGDLDALDVQEVAEAWGGGCLQADVDCDGQVNLIDLQIVASRWGRRLDDPGYDVRFDQDVDEDIDIVDVQQVAGRWGQAR